MPSLSPTSVFVGLVFSFALSGGLVAANNDSSVTLPKQEQLIGLIVSGNYPFRHETPAEVSAIERAFSEGEYAKVAFLARLYLATPYRDHENPPYLARLKADAYYYLYLLALRSGATELEANPFLIEAARLGHKQMITKFLDEVAQRELRVQDVSVHPENYHFQEIINIAAELGDPFATTVMANAPEGKLKSELRDYWQLQSMARNEIREARLVAVKAALRAMGPARFSKVQRAMSLVGDITPPDPRGLPGRGDLATVFTEMLMRDSLGASIGMSIEVSGGPPAAPTILEGYRTLAGLVNNYGMADAYLLVPTGTQHRGHQIRSMKRKDIMDSLLPGDCVYVTCGGLSHAAVLFQYDRKNRQLQFLDSNHQYWQPSHNSCITQRSFLDFGLGRGLVVLDSAEVLPLLQAVKTIRDRHETAALPHQKARDRPDQLRGTSVTLTRQTGSTTGEQGPPRNK